MDKSPDTPTSLSTTVAALGGVIVGALGFATAVAGGWFTYAGKDQELKVHLVEIAVSILRADPKEDVGGARGWALDIMERNSGVPFSADDRAALLHKPLKIVDINRAAQAVARANEQMFEGWDEIVKEESGVSGAPHTPTAANIRDVKRAQQIMIDAEAYRIKQAADAAEAARQKESRDKSTTDGKPQDSQNHQ
jgi:hypothetical protein